LAWFGTGNRFGNVMPFLKSSYAIVSGFGPANSVNSSESLFGYVPPNQTFVFWWAALVVIVIGALAFAHTYKLNSRARIGILLATLVVVWLLFKEGFVRNDSSHNLIFFAAAPLLVTAFDLGRRFWGVLVAGLLALCVVTVVVAGGMPKLVYEPFTSARNFFHEATTLASARQRAHFIEGSRDFLRAWYGIPAPMLALMRGQTVDVAPEEQSVAWVYPEVHFDPLPIIQDYVAYTPFLDQLDRSYLASPEAPRFILRSPGAIDGRNPAFEPPATQLAIECRYREVMSTANWQLLQRSRNLCGPTRYLGTVTTEFNHWIPVPKARYDDSVVATFHLSLGYSWELQTIVFKPPELFMGYNYGQQDWRFVAATAPDLHVLHAASTLRYSRPFAPTSIARFRFFFGGSSGSHPAVEVSFYEIHLK
jgi:hypothetical protein